MTTAQNARPSLDRAPRRTPALAWWAGAAALATLALPAHALAAVARDGAAESTPLGLDDAASSGSGSADVGTSGGSIARVIIGLLVVVAAIYAVTWVLKQLKRSKDAPSGPGLQIVSTTPLHAGSALQLVRVGDELLLLAVGASATTEVRRYTREEAEEADLWPDAAPDPDPGDDDGAGTGSASGGGNAFSVLGRTVRWSAVTVVLGRWWDALVTRLREMTVRG